MSRKLSKKHQSGGGMDSFPLSSRRAILPSLSHTGADLGWDDDWNNWEDSHKRAPLGRYLRLIAPLVGVMALSSYLVRLM